MNPTYIFVAQKEMGRERQRQREREREREREGERGREGGRERKRASHCVCVYTDFPQLFLSRPRRRMISACDKFN
jgi:hypothetical protein